MAKFNEKQSNNIVNLAGGKAYKESKKMKLVSLLLTSFGDDKYYRSEKETYRELKKLIESCDKSFVAKAIIYARTQFGMRTITHVASSMLAKHIGGCSWAKNFFDKVVYRVDDMTEIVSYHLMNKQKISNAMKKGFAMAFGRFDEYQLAKYKSEKKEVKLVDLVNICHPVQSERNQGAIQKLVNGELKSHDTWESMLSEAGSDRNRKIEVWNTLLDDNKLGYFALLRNIRNIVQLGDDSLKEKALNALLDENAIKRSLVLPFRYLTAYNELSRVDSSAMTYISKACEIALNNIPKLDGKTLVALDVSGSMASVKDIAGLFTAALLKTNNCDLVTFDYTARYIHVNTSDSVITIKNSIDYRGGGTNFQSIFNAANRPYDRIVLLSDMQSWVDIFFSRSPKQAYEDYKNRYNIQKCHFYSIDLAGYGTLQMPQNDVYCLAGFSEKIFDLMKFCEEDKNAIIHAINEIVL